WRDFPTFGSCSSDQDYPGMKDLSSEAATSHMRKTLPPSRLKRILKIFIVVILIFLISFSVIKKEFEDDEFKIKFQIFKTEDFANPVQNYFRIIPDDYVSRYTLTKERENVDLTLFRNDDLIYGIPRHSYHVINNST